MTLSRAIPRLFETIGIPAQDRIVVEHWMLPKANGHWFIVEHDPEGDIFFCYANLGDDPSAGWSYTSRAGLVDLCAVVDTRWTPKAFRDCVIASVDLARLYPPPKKIPITFLCLEEDP